MIFNISLDDIKENFDVEILNYKETCSLNRFSSLDSSDKNSIVFLDDKKYLDKILNKDNKFGLIISNQEINRNIPQIVTENPKSLFFCLVKNYYKKNNEKKGIHETAVIGENCEISSESYIGPYTIIGDNVKIGENSFIYGNTYIGDNNRIGINTTIYSGVNIYRNVVIGSFCIIHSGAVIGADGFGFERNMDSITKIPQIGEIVIEDNVEIGANTTIDRATLDKTIIEKNVKLDNLIQIAHNVRIKKNTLIAAQTGIAGSTEIGENCILGGQVGVGDHVSIGDGVYLTSQTGTDGDIEKPGTYSGTPARPFSKQYRILAYQTKLQKMWKKLKKLEKKIDGDE